MRAQITYYHLYKTFFFQILRVVVFLTIMFWVGVSLYVGDAMRVPLFFLSLFFMHEIFFRYHIAIFTPEKTIAENEGKDLLLSFSLQAADVFLFQSIASSMVSALFKQPSVVFMMQKAGFDSKKIVYKNIKKEQIVQQAYAIVKNIPDAKYITTADLFAAYILLIEDEEKLLLNNYLKKDEFLHILYWSRLQFSEEQSVSDSIHFWGVGVGEGLVSGWTLETKKYTVDRTPQFLSKATTLIGREQELRILEETLSKKENNNVLLVGEAGVGKEYLVAMFLYQNFLGKTQAGLRYKRIVELLIGSLLTGATGQGDLEQRLQAVLEELTHAGNIILYVPQFQNVLGSSSFGLDLSAALLPHLRSGKVPVISTMTESAYKTYFEHNAIREAFTIIRLLEPDENTAIQMILQRCQFIEATNNVALTYKAITAAVKYADKYLQDTVLPGSAVELLDDASHSASLAKKKQVVEEDIIQKIEERTNVAVGVPKQVEKDLLLHLEEKLHERVVDQQEAITAVAQALRRVRSGLASGKKPVSFLFLGPTGVGKTETAKALASVYFGAQDRMIRLDMSEYAGSDGFKRLLGALPGQGAELGELTEKVKDNPFSLVLLDEFEKASPQIHDLFLQVLDDGRLTDNKGTTVSFSDAIIIATSNAGSEFIREQVANHTPIDKTFQQQLLDLLQRQNQFKPELLNRFDAVVTFKPLGQQEVQAITKMLLQEVAKQVQQQDITVLFDEAIIQKVAKEGFGQEFGARPLRRYIQDAIEDILSKKILAGDIKRGDTVSFIVDAANQIQVTR